MRHLTMRFIRLHAALMTVTVGLLAMGPAGAEDCLDYPTTNPQIVFEGESGTSNEVAVTGDRAYVAVSGGVRAYDTGDPAQPVPLGLLPVSGWVSDLTAEGGYLYICVRSYGLQIASLADDGVPVLVASVPLSDGAHELTLQDGTAFIAAGVGGLAILDVGDPADPRLLSSAVGEFSVRHVARHGAWIYATGLEGGLTPVDVSDPAHPVVGPLLGEAGDVTCLTSMDGRLYVGTRDARVLSFDLSIPSSPSLLDALQIPDFPTSMSSRFGVLWVSAFSTGLIAVDTSDPSSLTVGDLVEVSGAAYDAEHDTLLTYVAGSNELRILDLSVPTTDATLGWYHAPYGLSDFVVVGERAYGLDHFDGLVTLDVSDPRNPTEVDRLPLPGENLSIVVDGDHAFVAAGAAGILVVALTDADRPELALTVTQPGSATDVALSGHRLLASLRGGAPECVVVLDVSDWRAPVAAGSVWVYNPGELVVDGDLTIAVSNGSLKFIDISQASTPVVVGSWQPETSVTGLAMGQGVAHVCDLYGRLTVLDIADPAQPTVVGGCETAPWTYDLLLSGNVAYLASSIHGVLAVDVADPALPRYVGASLAAGSADLVRLAGNLIYVGTFEEGFSVTGQVCPLDAAGVIPGAGSATALSAFPNPFNPRTSIAFDLASAADVSVEIVDLGGRRVRTLLTATAMDAGSHALVWDGRDDGGRAQSAGVYVARLAAGSDRAQVKVTLLK